LQALAGKMEQLKNEFAKVLSDKIEALRTEMEESSKRTMNTNQLKLDNIWGQQMIKVFYLFSSTYASLINANV
jgi:hypothetical protein